MPELKKEIESGHTEWIDRLCYFSKSQSGTSAFWRQKRAQVYSWINFHVSQGNGPPDLFITFSCSEYHWKDIEVLLEERMSYIMKKGTTSKKKMKSRIVNELTIVIQEYFQEQVKIWLKTVGKYVFGIEHFWLRYEFAPLQGQIHCHMLAITKHSLNHMKILNPSRSKQEGS